MVLLLSVIDMNIVKHIIFGILWLGVTHFYLVPELSKIANKHAGGQFHLEGRESLIAFGIYLAIMVLIAVTNG